MYLTNARVATLFHSTGSLKKGPETKADSGLWEAWGLWDDDSVGVRQWR